MRRRSTRSSTTLAGLVSLTVLIAACGGGAPVSLGSPSTTTGSNSTTSRPTTLVPQVAALGTAIHLVDIATHISGTETWIERATVRLVDVIDPATLTRGQLSYPSGTPTVVGGHWVGLRLEITNDGPMKFGGESGRYQPTLDFPTDRSYRSPLKWAVPVNLLGCPAVNYWLLPPGASTTGCVGIELPRGSSIKTLEVVLLFSGIGGDTQPIAEWHLR